MNGGPPAAPAARDSLGRGACAAEWHVLADPNHFWMRWRLAAALRQLTDLGLPLSEPWRVLDVGCGRGVLGRQLESRTQWTVDGIDRDPEAVAFSSAGRGTIFQHDVSDGDFGAVRGDYDAALLYDVIEHLEDPDPVLRGVRRRLKAGAPLLVNVPAVPRLTSEYDRAVGHVRRYDRRGLTEQLLSGGYRIRDLRYWGFSLVPVLAIRKALVARGSSREAIVERGFATPGRLAAGLLKLAMQVETATLSHPPLGASLLAVAESPAT